MEKTEQIETYSICMKTLLFLKNKKMNIEELVYSLSLYDSLGDNGFNFNLIRAINPEKKYFERINKIIILLYNADIICKEGMHFYVNPIAINYIDENYITNVNNKVNSIIHLIGSDSPKNKYIYLKENYNNEN